MKQFLILTIVLLIFSLTQSYAQAPFTTLVKEPIFTKKENELIENKKHSINNMGLIIKENIDSINKKEESKKENIKSLKENIKSRKEKEKSIKETMELNMEKKNQLDFFKNNGLEVNYIENEENRLSVNSEVLHYKLHIAQNEEYKEINRNKKINNKKENKTKKKEIKILKKEIKIIRIKCKIENKEKEIENKKEEIENKKEEIKTNNKKNKILKKENKILKINEINEMKESEKHRYNIPFMIITKLSTSYDADTIGATSSLDVLDYEGAPITMRIMPSAKLNDRSLFYGFYADARGLNLQNTESNDYDMKFIGSGGVGLTYKGDASVVSSTDGEPESGRFTVSAIFQGAMGEKGTIKRLFDTNKKYVTAIQCYLLIQPYKKSKNSPIVKIGAQHFFQKPNSGNQMNISLALGI